MKKLFKIVVIILLSLIVNHHKSFAKTELKIGAFLPLTGENEIIGQNIYQSILITIFELKNLTILNFYSNNIREIPQEIVKLENLEHLNFSRNEINDIPAELWQLQKLRSLDFGGNNLSSVSPDIARLHKLNSLSVSNNQLQNLPQEIQGLPLEVINVGRNNIDVDLIQSWFPKCRVDDY